MGIPYEDVDNLTLVSGPRWRLKPNKFGQDLPGLELPLVECSEPPFQSDNIKYAVGEPTTTIINLLDWADENGPLATSKGWVDVTANEFVTIEGTDPISGVSYTTNGLPMTDDFDLAVYVKGDRKSTAVYNATLVIEYGDQVEVDTDGDGVPDTGDNCTLVANPAQEDTDGDGYGNICDGDLNQDGETDLSDNTIFRDAFGTEVGDADFNPDADFNSDGAVDLTDNSIFRGLFGSPPGPSCTDLPGGCV
jgi:hypothetical protein